MKKMNLAILVAMGLGFSGVALAAPTPMSGSSPITTTDCVLLKENVNVNLSANVAGAYECTESNTTIKLAMCHATGSRKTRPFPCTILNPQAVSENAPAIWSAPGCPVGTIGVPPYPGAVEIEASYTGYTASSQGGAVNEEPLSGNCAQTTLGGLGIWYE